MSSSNSLRDNAGVVLRMLDEVRQPLPPVVLDICERFVQAHGANIGDITTAAAGDASPSSTRRRCLDLIDQLVAIRAHGIDRDLASIDR